MVSMQGLDKAIEVAGSVEKLADKLGLYQGAVSNWRMRKQIPAERCHDIVRVTNGAVSLHELRPDIWPELAPRKRKVAA